MVHMVSMKYSASAAEWMYVLISLMKLYVLRSFSQIIAHFS